MSKCYMNKDFFRFLESKQLPLDEYEEEMSDMLCDQFNTGLAEAALDVSFDLFPEKPGEDEDTTFDKRHEFVSEYMDYAQNEIIKKWASNLGMIDVKKSQENANAQGELVSKIIHKRFKDMSSYEFSQWKLTGKNTSPGMADDTMPSEYEPQDSEDEAWEQMRVFQASQSHSQDL